MAKYKQSKGEKAFLYYWDLLSELPPPPKPEFMFAKDTSFQRDWRFDFAWPDNRLAVEIDGGTWMSKHGGKSRHTTGTGYEGDCEKLNAAAILGWKVLRYTTTMLANDPVGVVNQVKQLLNETKPDPPTFKRGKPGTLIDDDLLIDLDDESEGE